MRVTLTDIRLVPDPKRVVARPFLPGASVFVGGDTRLGLIVDRVLGLPEAEAGSLLEGVREGFVGRHHDLESLWESHAVAAAERAGVSLSDLSVAHRLLLGAYFTNEYAPSSAALCNPSIVAMPAPDDPGRFVLSLRAVGEGHISSVAFRTGRVDDDGRVSVDPPAPRSTPGTRRAPTYDKTEFADRLGELGPDDYLAGLIMSQVGDEFTVDDLDRAIADVRTREVSEAAIFETARMAHWVATSNYEVTFADGPLSGNVLMPSGPADSRGIEDVRFVRFVDDGEATYYGTYTAFDGFAILPQLIETADFRSFRLSTLSGDAARNKGMALFPRKIDGSYCALGRLDQESIYVLRSDRVRSWIKAEVVYGPMEWWEAIQVGNCGAPIETDRGWLVLTHGVGPMRRYSIGAILLDLDRPERLLARTVEPLITPVPDDRDGYVPNVVYSCGALLHEETLVVPFGFSDWGVRVATVPVDELLDDMVPV